jgi:hypothetical protein
MGVFEIATCVEYPHGAEGPPGVEVADIVDEEVGAMSAKTKQQKRSVSRRGIKSPRAQFA